MALVAVITAFAISCAPTKPEKTIESLKAAIAGETNASAKYQVFSEIATEQGYLNIAQMFAAASFAEALHVKNHNAVLEKLGEQQFNPAAETSGVERNVILEVTNEFGEVDTVEVLNPKATNVNIQTAIDGETYEFTEMYPAFITIAKEEKCEDALTTLMWAMEAEKGHAKLYAEALNILDTTGLDANVSSFWYVCTKCGDLHNTIEDLDVCPVCGENPDSFEKFFNFLGEINEIEETEETDVEI